MELTQEQRTEIEEIANRINCPKNLECYKSEPEKLCQVRDFGLDEYLDCLEETAKDCEFSLSFGNGYLCTCPVRIYIAKKLKK